MPNKNLLIISNDYPNEANSYITCIFVKEQVKYLKEHFDAIYVISPVAYGMDRLRNFVHRDYQYDNVKVFFPHYLNNPFFFFRGRSFWVTLEANAICSLIEREHLAFDMIHAHFTWPSGAVAAEIKKRYHVPLVITEHTSTTFADAVRKRDVSWKTALKAADAIIRVREGDTHLFEDLDVPSEKVISIPNGFDHETFFPRSQVTCREKLNLPLDKKILLNVGNLYDPVKGHSIFIEAMSLIVPSHEDVLGIIVGSGKLEPELRAQIQKLCLEDHIRLVGSKPHTEIPYWMNACDLFVLPSLNEGNPTVMFEALGCGKPFIGTRVGGVPDVIKSDDYGLLALGGDASNLADKIHMGLKKEWDREKILCHAEQYSWKNISKEIASIYRTISENDSINGENSPTSSIKKIS